MAALMTSLANVEKQIARYIKHCKKDLGIEVRPPSVNYSTHKFVVDDSGAIRFSLVSAKGVGEDAVKQIVEERERNGKFKTVTEFIKRCYGDKVTAGTIDGLIRSGAFDEFDKKRSELLAVFNDMIDWVKAFRDKPKKSAQNQLFDCLQITRDETPNLEELPMKILLRSEKRSIGLYLSGHPLDSAKSQIAKLSNVSSLDFIKETNDEGIVTKECVVRNGQFVSVIGIVTDIREVKTKNKDLMAFVTVEDMDDELSIVVFPKTYAVTKEELVEDNIIHIIGKVSFNKDNPEERPSILADRIVKLDHKLSERITIVLDDIDNDSKFIKDISEQCHGDIPVFLLLNNRQILLDKCFWINHLGKESLKNHFKGRFKITLI